MIIKEDGSILINIDGHEQKPQLTKYRKYHSAIEAGIGTFYFTDGEYTEILYEITGQPAPNPTCLISFYMRKIK